MSELPASSHLLQSAIVLDEPRLVYVPVPKAGSTAILWALVELAGLHASDFRRSTKPEVTRSLAVHDMSIWGRSRRLEGRSADEIDWILSSAEWFRFTVVREPLRRLWSAWVSKILVRDPRFVAAYGHEDWFRTSAHTPDEVISAFRSFVRAVGAGRPEWHNSHWGAQVELVAHGAVRYDVVGRVERLSDALAAVDAHVRARGGPGVLALGRENSSLLPFSPGLFDAATLAACRGLVARDEAAFGYDSPQAASGEPGDEWRAKVDAVLDVVRAVSQRNERIGDLRRLLEAERDRGLLRRAVGRA